LQLCLLQLCFIPSLCMHMGLTCNVHVIDMCV
jgi:hypothetical protein